MGHRSADVNVLVLGDGDLSFSLSLVKRLETEKLTGDRRISVLCTSYDTRDDVIGRYPASRSIIASLLRRSGGAGAEEAGSSRKRKRVRKLSETSVCVLHRVNAAAIEETLSAAGNEYVATTFDLLWFNFPHSGAEDRPRHRALLRHFFASAASLLRRQVVSGRRSCFDSADSGVSATTGARDASDGGSATGTSDSAGAGDAAAREFDGRQRKYRPVVHLALAGQQAERWECLGAATAAGFDLLAVLPFCDDAFPGYVRRRNTKGKSFRRTRPGESHAASAEAVGVGSRGGAGKGGGRGGTEEEGASIGKQPQIRASKSELGARVLLFALRDEETAHEADTGLGFNLPAPASVDKVAGILKHARVSPTVISLLVASVVPAPGCRKAQSQEGQAEGASSGAWHSCPVAGCLKGYRSVRGLKTHMMQFHRPRSDLAVACATQASSQVQREMPSEKTSFSCSGEKWGSRWECSRGNEARGRCSSCSSVSLTCFTRTALDSLCEDFCQHRGGCSA